MEPWGAAMSVREIVLEYGGAHNADDLEEALNRLVYETTEEAKRRVIADLTRDLECVTDNCGCVFTVLADRNRHEDAIRRLAPFKQTLDQVDATVSKNLELMASWQKIAHELARVLRDQAEECERLQVELVDLRAK